MANRGRINALIIVFLLFQLIIPLTYYVREDPYDERFAWRMFSGIRMQSCQPHASRRGDSENYVGIDLTKTLQSAWITMIERNRPAVISAFLASQCEQEGTQRARIISYCKGADDEVLPERTYELDCTTMQMLDPGAGDS